MKGKNFFPEKLIHWYIEHKRALPWRDTGDPYKIWLSEIILQQTRVSQGLPYYLSFVEKYPSVVDLAAAPEQEVLRLWQGLGYYSRARNLHRCAKVVVENFGGQFPDNYSALLKLPGIGTYTAAAIASFAFAEAVPVVDGNVFRVLARHFGIEKDISSNSAKEFFMAKASELIPQETPGIFNQAIMEFGALHCTPQNPKCDECIFKRSCVAYQEESQHLYPVKSKKLTVRKRYFYYFVIEEKGKLLMKPRGSKDIWQGLFDFYLVETKRHTRLDKIKDRDEFLKNLEFEKPSKTYKHVLSHQLLFATFISVKIPSAKAIEKLLKTQSLKWHSHKQILALPKPALVSRYLETIGIVEAPLK